MIQAYNTLNMGTYQCMPALYDTNTHVPLPVLFNDGCLLIAFQEALL